MKNKALFKSNLREIYQSKARFFSMLMIILLGVGFYAGIKATGPDMIDTADTYFKDQQLMDTKIVATIGLEGKDVDLVSKQKNVSVAEGAYSMDATEKNENQILKLMSYSKEQKLNKPLLVEGRLPEKSGEIVLDSQVSENNAYKVGDTLTIDNKDNQLKKDSYKVVGLVQSPLYIDRVSRGNTTIGKGTIDFFAMVPTEDFNLDVFTEIYVTYKNTSHLQAFSSDYKNQVKKDQNELKNILSNRIKTRFDTIKSDGNKEINEAKDQIDNAEILLETSKTQLETKKEELTTQKASIETSEAAGQIVPDYLKKALSQNEEELNKQQETLESETKKLETSKEKLDEQVKALNDLGDSSYIFTDRNSNPAYSEYYDNADRISSIATVFPVFFFLIAALICLTTMTRMVEEKRGEIGTLKALGYTNLEIAQKFILYGFLASVVGSLVGLIVGFNLFPKVIFNAYGSLYNLPSIIITYYLDYTIQSVCVAILCTLVSAIVVLRVDLLSTPSVLMRPKAPKPGKRILIEKIGWLWSRFNFNQKVTARNLFRYKLRVFMTIIGIAGCMALMITGFGIKDSIGDIAELQFSKIWHYDATVTFNQDATDDQTKEYEEKLTQFTNLDDRLSLLQNTVDVSRDGYKTQEATLDVPSETKDLNEFMTFKNRVTEKEYPLDDKGAIINEKLAKLFNVSEGDTLQLKKSDDKVVDIKISRIVENYAMHFIYITPTYYEKLFGEKPVSNVNFLTFNKQLTKKQEQQLAESLIDTKKAINVTYTNELSDSLKDTMGSLTIVIWVLIISAGTLAFIVLYNLTNINISERIRELSTMKVLGFYEKEVTMYVYRENNILTGIGIVVGCLLGGLLERFVIKTAEVDMLMFPNGIHFLSYVYSALLTILFSLIVMYFMHQRIKKVDMIQSLKSNE